MNPQKIAIGVVTTLLPSLVLAEDFKTINGKEYKNATVSRVEADGIVLRSKSGTVALANISNLFATPGSRFRRNGHENKMPDSDKTHCCSVIDAADYSKS